tara:strand:- start:6091 stop:6282 length:192 start_codon:yes stop_codon:yes gene_type:complete
MDQRESDRPIVLETDRIAVLEKRLSDLEELVELLMSLKQKKLDISNFTCARIDLKEKTLKTIF